MNFSEDKPVTDTVKSMYDLDFYDQLPSLAEVMSEVIGFFGGRDIYGIGGDFAANLIAGLGEQVNIYPCGNEMHAGFSACAQAEVEGLGFCLTTYMVGSLPCTSAAAMAMTEGLPVVFISGAPAEFEVHKQAIHHTIHPNNSWKAQYDNALESFEALGMKVERLQGQRVEGQPSIAGERFFQLVSHAYKTKQPVFIEVPRDQVFAKTQPLKLPRSVDSICCGSNVLGGTTAMAELIVGKLNQSRAPVLYVGDRLKHNAKLKGLLTEFSHKFNIPYITSWFAKGLFDEYEPLCLGCYNGVFTEGEGRSYVENTMDYVIDVATSILPQDANVALGTGTHKIEDFNNKTVLKGASLLEADLIAIFERLLEADIPRFAFHAVQNSAGCVADDAPVDFNNLANTLNELQQLDARPYVYLPEVGNSYFASYSLKVRASKLGRSWLTNPWYGAMGTSLPYARVVAQQIKSRELNERTVVITGDGGFHFQLNELIQFLKDKTSVTIIYMRNNVFHLGKSGDTPIYHCNDEAFDVHALVAAYQGQSQMCRTVGEFKACFNRYIDENEGIKLIEVPAVPIESRQCHEIKLLNLYIKSQNGVPQAVEQWRKLVS